MKFREYDQSQTKFAALDYRSILDEDSDAVLINDIVERLDLSLFEEKYPEIGNLGYHPKAMIKIIFWGYYKGYFGGRPLHRQYQTDLALRYFSNDDFPDHRTINKFRVKFKSELPDVFAQVVLLCLEVGLIGFENLCIDSQKIKANANLFQNKDLKGIQKEKKRIKEQLDKLLDQEINFQQEAEHDRKKRERLQRRRQKLDEAATLLQQSETGRSNITDPDSRVMIDKRGVRNPDFNCHTAVDDKVGVITGVRVTNDSNENTDLIPLKEESKKNTGRCHNHTLADCGYSDKEGFVAMEEDTETEYFVPDRTMYESEKDPYRKWNFRYIPERDVFRCPGGYELPFLRWGRDDKKVAFGDNSTTSLACMNSLDPIQDSSSQ